MPGTSQRRRIWPVLKWVLFAVVLIFIGRRAQQIWQAAPTDGVRIKFLWFIPAFLMYFVGWFPSIWFWRAMLRKMKQPLGWWDATRAYVVGNTGKYIPGKALVLVIRGSLVKEAGVNPVLAGVTAAYETLVFMAAGAMLAAALAPWTLATQLRERLPESLAWIYQQPMVISVGVIAATFATTPFSSWLFTKIGRKALPSSPCTAGSVGMANDDSISAWLIFQGVIVTSLGWGCHALSLGCVLQSVSNQAFDLTRFPIWLSACAMSTVGGFVVLIAPGGIGVREGLLIEVLKDQPEVGPATAIVAAALLRAVWFVTELITTYSPQL